jgi:hypothetical protein
VIKQKSGIPLEFQLVQLIVLETIKCKFGVIFYEALLYCWVIELIDYAFVV